MVKYGDSGRAYQRQRTRGRHRPKRQPIDAVSVFFFLSPFPFYTSLSLSQHDGNQEQAVNR